ncbi:ABC transporter ATP-binding protein [Clostridium sp. MSJ-11]|uniref:ABC transporter ATP-binding protein n=1 Tax=Clostridium mobile TaxID=2841512 RepID=A0ABS6EKQ9_9CLOT|nr:ABC transporter ATP-binding protein [Clostridium mobile]MBU5485638.1 ABC transporter ATP-binding protein [Clostridium mobile]
MSIVAIESLTRKFGNFVALDNVNFKIEEGEIYGLLGPNGAGKSTIINIICGLLKPNNGKIKIFNKDISGERKFIKSNIGIVPQDIAIYEDLTVFENVKFFGSLYGLKGSSLKENSLTALEFVELGDKTKKFPSELSGGMKRRLNIACALAHKPKLIIMDEPTVGIDPQSRNHILQSVKKLNSLGSAIIYTSHYMEEVEEICSKIAIIDHGKLIAEGTKDELKSLVWDKQRIIITIDSLSSINEKEIRKIPGVNEVVVKDNKVEISSNKDINNMEQIILYFTKNNLSIQNVESNKPNLETVFLTLTGRKLRH